MRGWEKRKKKIKIEESGMYELSGAAGRGGGGGLGKGF